VKELAMKRTFKATAIAFCLIAAPTLTMAKMPASADTAAPAMMMDKATFVKVAGSANEFEIESSKMAEEKATSADVKAFAATMIKDHTMAAEGLQKAARVTGEPPPALSPKHAAMLKTLEGATGSEFQALYIDMQTTAHMDAVTLFATYAKGGDDPAVKAFAAKTLPKLEMHKMHVLKLVAAH
jgi:putative membrane protein